VGILSRIIFLEVAASAALGTILFVFVLFLQKAGQLFSILVSSTTSASNVGYIFLLLLPATMPLSVPLGTLVGVLIALSRMSSDSEITALRAAGVPARRVAIPVSAVALLAMALTGFCSLVLTPWCNGEIVRVLNRMGAAQITAAIQPRIFEESFPRTVLYVGDVQPGNPVKWKGTVFMADLTPPADRQGGAEKGDGPRITIAREAVVTAENDTNRLQMSMPAGATYEVGPDPDDYYVVQFKQGEQELAARSRAQTRAKGYTATPTVELMAESGKSQEAFIELHQRFALPLASLLLALTGIPLGVSSRKGGKSAAFVITVSVAFLYYMALVTLIGLAREGRMAPALAVWLPNAVFAVLGILLLVRLERPGDRGLLDTIFAFLSSHVDRFRHFAEAFSRGSAAAGKSRFFLLPQVIDTYVLSTFLFYLAVLLASFVMLIEVFNFFELLGDAFRNQIPMREMAQYLFFLAPMLIYDATPVSVLVAVLVTFGVLTKSNEITAFKACGVSLYRISMPVLLACFVLSGGLFAFDYYVVTNANLVQDRLRNKIKGNPVKTYLSPDRQWIRGEGQGLRIFYYKYFNSEEGLLGTVNVYEIDEKKATLKRHIFADRARWEPTLKTWIFQNGWVRELGDTRDNYRDFRGGALTFPDLTETPAWFAKEVKTYRQMNFAQLANYISELRVSGFNTTPLQVQYYRKFSVPLFALVMSMLSVPFAFLAGNRGAMTGVGVSLGVAISYFALNTLFEQLGNVNQLLPVASAWAPGLLFALTGTYLMTRMRT
jgi:LPS export ABC transporter permease LptG/LPS export ABC transporter permease LptF